MTEQLAGISLFAILVVLAILTAMRSVLHASRIAVLRSVAELLESVLLAVVIVFLLVRPFLVQSYFIPSGSMHPTLWEGDHILVNKAVYRFHRPERGDIIVFHAPREVSPDEKEFIKRLIGLPGDLVSIKAAYVTVGATIYTPDNIRACLGQTTGLTTLGSADPPPLRLTSDDIWLGNRCISQNEFAQIVHKPGQPVFIHPGRVIVNGQMLMESFVVDDVAYDWPSPVGVRLVPNNAYFVLGDNRNDSEDSHLWGMLPAERVIGRADCIFWPFPHARRLP